MHPLRMCEKHQKIIARFSNERQNEIITSYIDLAINPPELQDKVDRRKNQCPVCFFRAEGVKMLKKVIKMNRGSKRKILA